MRSQHLLRQPQLQHMQLHFLIAHPVQIPAKQYESPHCSETSAEASAEALRRQLAGDFSFNSCLMLLAA